MISIFVEWNNKILIFANCVSTCKVVFHLMPLELNFSLLARTECPMPRLSGWGATLWKVPSASNLPLLRRKFVVKFLPQSCQVRKFFLPLLITLERDLYREHTSASPCSTLLIKKRNSPSILVWKTLWWCCYDCVSCRCGDVSKSPNPLRVTSLSYFYHYPPNWASN